MSRKKWNNRQAVVFPRWVAKEQHRQFVDALTGSCRGNATRACLEVYGGEESTARQRAYKLLQRAEVQAMLQEVYAARHGRQEMTREELLQMYEEDLRTCVTDVMEFGPEGAFLRDSGAVDPARARAIEEVSVERTRHGHKMRVKLLNKLQARRQYEELRGWRRSGFGVEDLEDGELRGGLVVPAQVAMGAPVESASRESASHESGVNGGCGGA